MCRDRAWRRYMEERIVIRRLTDKLHLGRWYWRGFDDANGVIHQHPVLSDYIGSSYYFTAKTHTTKKWDSRHKIKYSPNKNGAYYRDVGSNSKTREKDRILFFKILKEYGIK